MDSVGIPWNSNILVGIRQIPLELMGESKDPPLMSALFSNGWVFIIYCANEEYDENCVVPKFMQSLVRVMSGDASCKVSRVHSWC